MGRALYLDGVDMTPPSLTVDLLQNFEEDMELAYPEIEVFQNDTATINVSVTSGGNPFDLTGYSVLYQARKALGDVAFLFNEAGQITDATGGQFQVTLTAADLAVAGTFPSQFYATKNGTTLTIMAVPLVVQQSV